MSETPTASPPITLLDWRPIQKGGLRGFAKFRLGRSIIINDIAIHNSGGKKWAFMPSKPVHGPDGAQKIGDNGKPIYAKIVEWVDRAASDRFSETAIRLIEAEHPGATD